MSTKNSDLDLKRQTRKIYMYANANVLLRKFSSCSFSVKCLYLRHIVLHYIVLLCGSTAPRLL